MVVITIMVIASLIIGHSLGGNNDDTRPILAISCIARNVGLALFIAILNNVEQNYTVVGRSSPNSTVSGTFLVNTVVPNSLLTVRNPSSNSTALTITPLAGGAMPVSAHLIITRIN
jgi:hypothetical protein